MRCFIRLNLFLLSFLLCFVVAYAEPDSDITSEDEVILSDDIPVDENVPSDLDIYIPVVGADGQLLYVSPEQLNEFVNNAPPEDELADVVDDIASPPMILYSSPALGSSGLSGDVYLDIPDTPPANAPFNGEYYITGYSGSQRVVIYTPNSDGWGVDDNGYLVRLGSSATGQLYLNGSIPNNVSFSSYGYPRYRSGTTGTSYIDLHIVPDASNINIYKSFPLKSNTLGFTVPDYSMFFLGGLIVVILLTKRRK